MESNLNFRWRKTSGLRHSADTVLNIADGMGNERIDYSQFGMVNRHENDRVTNMIYADGHGLSWRILTPIRESMNRGSSLYAQSFYEWY
jgi:hypothetical protein